MIAQIHTRHPTVEILGPWLLNKGDELMLRAVFERLGGRFELAASEDLKMAGHPDLPPLPRVKWQPTAEEFREAVRHRSTGECLSAIKRGVAIPLLSRRILRSQGLIDGREVNALLDCSGFAYGDQWSPRRLEKRFRYYRRLRANQGRLIMLPQALGPFDRAEIREHARRLLEQFDLIYAREAVSQRHVLDLGIDPARVAVCPDISHLLAGRVIQRAEEWEQRVAVVPNARMLDKTERAVADRYLNFLVICVERIRAAGLEPCILLHETNDATLLEQLLARLDHRPPVFNEDGVTTKGMLQHCYANLGSRYHSLVSSLSQAVPSLGTSWSHKYEALFNEYGCESCVISPALDDATLGQRIDAFLAPARNQQLRELLRPAATAQSRKVMSMWDQVEALIHPCPKGRLAPPPGADRNLCNDLTEFA